MLQLHSLTYLNISGIGLNRLEPDTFGSFVQLTELHMSDNDLESLPDSITCLSNLRILSMSNNPFRRLPSALWLDALEELFAAYLPPLCTDFSPMPPSCSVAHSRRNCITGLSAFERDGLFQRDGIAKMTKLQCLDLRNNGLSSLPHCSCLVRWGHMKRMRFSHNQLTAIHPDIGRMGMLEELYLEHNRLDSLPAELAKLSQLRVLALQGNLIAELPAQLGNMTSLRQLDMDHQHGCLRYVVSSSPRFTPAHTAAMLFVQISATRGCEYGFS